MFLFHSFHRHAELSDEIQMYFNLSCALPRCWTNGSVYNDLIDKRMNHFICHLGAISILLRKSKELLCSICISLNFI